MRVSLFAVLLAVASAPALAADKPEPKYEGKPLDYWMARFQKAETDDQRKIALAALVAFGADAAPAVPTLIEMLTDHSSTYRGYVVAILGNIGPKAQDARPDLAKAYRKPSTEHHREIVAAITATSPTPQDAVPFLVPLLDTPSNGYFAYRALCVLGAGAKDAIPAIRKYVLNELAEKEKHPAEHSLFGLDGLARLGPDVVPLLAEMLNVNGGHGRSAAIACLEELGEKATGAAHALLDVLKCDDLETRYRAAALLWNLDKHPAAVPALIRLIGAEIEFEAVTKSSIRKLKSNFAADAARTLGDIGPGAKDALPALRQAVAVGISGSALSGVCFDQSARNSGGGFVMVENVGGYEQHLSFQALAATGRAAAEAIDKIEGKPKK